MDINQFFLITSNKSEISELPAWSHICVLYKNDHLIFILEYVLFSVKVAVADPGFPRGGGANSPGGAPTYEFVDFSQKLHEIERIWTPRGGARPLRPP